jgi:undecaprenyl-phosphate glucose phosphotransferase
MWAVLGNFQDEANFDELPQFWNVSIGNMSVVGPRPEREHFVEWFKEDIPNYKVRHFVKSDITDLAQVNGWRGDTSIEKRIESDIHYIENWSMWLDIEIIWKTIFGKETQKNAY